MRILFLTQVLPYPLDAGPKVRAYFVLRHLARRHQVTLVSFVRGTDTEEAKDHLGSYCSAVHTVPITRSLPGDAAHLLGSLVTGAPFLIARDSVPAMDRLVADLAGAQDFDAVHSDQLWMAPYALAARERARGRRPMAVLDQHNAVYQIPQRMARWERNPLKRAVLELEWRKLARYEARVCREFDRVVWVTEQDRVAVRAAGPAGGSPGGSGCGGPVIPICGDPEATPALQGAPGARRVTFLGGLHYPPNAQGVLWFAREAWTVIAREVPDAILTVIGKDPPAELRSRGSVVGNVEVTGYLKDPLPYLRETAVFIVPILAGGGMRVKIVEAWLWGLPVVSTMVGAEGIEASPGENILIADTPADFARAVVGLLARPAEGERLGSAGRRWAEERYSWRTVYPAWDAVYSEA